MRRLLIIIFKSKIIAKLLQNTILNLHSKAYLFSGYIASILNDGVHPKHRIMKYKEWFLDNIQKDN